MKRIGLSLLWVLALAWPRAEASAAAKKKAAPAKAAAAPKASTEEIAKLKGDFKWGMSPEEVITKVTERIQAVYQDRLDKSAKNAMENDRLRKNMRGEIAKVQKGSLMQFDGNKTGYDVSIIDQEFSQNIHESMLVAKEETSTRYFFFAYDRLYKMFVAFDKEMMKGKTFVEFGGLMQARFGKAKEVFVEEKTKKGVSRKLDYYLWHTNSDDVLRLVDRSAFYGVYCLVLYEGRVAETQADARKAQPQADSKDTLVEAVIDTKPADRDSNDNILDRATGRTVYKPGEGPAPEAIVVPSQSGLGPSPAEINRPAVSDEPAEGSKVGKPAAKSPAKGKETSRPSEARGLEL